MAQVNSRFRVVDESLTVPPERSNLVLSSDIPNSEGDVLVLHSLDIESYDPKDV